MNSSRLFMGVKINSLQHEAIVILIFRFSHNIVLQNISLNLLIFFDVYDVLISVDTHGFALPQP